MNVSANSPLSDKKEALRFVAQTLVDNDEPDFELKFHASSTLSALNVPDFDEVERAIFVDNEIRGIKNELQKKIEANAPGPAEADVQMGQGIRKRRRTKKARRRNKRGSTNKWRRR